MTQFLRRHAVTIGIFSFIALPFVACGGSTVPVTLDGESGDVAGYDGTTEPLDSSIDNDGSAVDGGADDQGSEADGTTDDGSAVDGGADDQGSEADGTTDDGSAEDDGGTNDATTNDNCETPIRYYLDHDQDGYGTDAESEVACSAPVGYVARAGDCDDANPEIHPGATELCNGADDDCDDRLDEGFAQLTYFFDADNDGWGGPGFVTSCAPPAGYVQLAGDCSDYNPDIHPTASERCNGIDDDCDHLIDEDLSVFVSYRDNDGDGIPPLGAQQRESCDVPFGWALPRDIDGDGNTDWDCDDSNVTVYPGAPTTCGDNRDNNCDGYVDRFCFDTCEGAWQDAFYTTGGPNASIWTVDMDGDNSHELIINSAYHFSILNARGEVLIDRSTLRGQAHTTNDLILADLDDSNRFSDQAQTLEATVIQLGLPRAYKLNGDKTVSEYSVVANTPGLDGWGRALGWDINGDGAIEYIANIGSVQARVYRIDPAQGAFVHVGDISDPQQEASHHDERMLTDLDGDGRTELVFGNGVYSDTDPSRWSGQIQALTITSQQSLSTSDYCTDCFDTADPTSVYYPSWVDMLFRFGDQVRARIVGYTTNIDGELNQRTYRYGQYDTDGNRLTIGTSPTVLYQSGADLDDDGTPENYADVLYGVGLYDVNGDGYPDRVTHSGTQLRLQLWDPERKAFVNNPGSELDLGMLVTVRAIWDIDSDGRLEVLSSDSGNNVHCHQLGRDTWNKYSSLPPLITPLMRTKQADNFEPNEGHDWNADGIPDEVVRIPSALTRDEQFYGYLSHPGDKDYYLVNTLWAGRICVRAPKGRRIRMKVFAFPINGRPAGEMTEGGKVSAAGGQVCWTGTEENPQRYGEYKFIVGVEPVEASDATPYWPYWIDT